MMDSGQIISWDASGNASNNYKDLFGRDML